MSRSPLPDERQGHLHRFQVGEQKGYVRVGLYPDGRVGEVFINVSKQGSTVNGLLSAVGILASYCLQMGGTLDEVCSKMRGMKFDPMGMTQTKDIPRADSILDYVFTWLEMRFGPTR